MLKIWENTMLILKNADEINSVEGFELRQLLTSRRKQLNCHLYILENDDTADDLERAIGFPVMTNIFDGVRYPDQDFVPCCEALDDHGFCYELLYLLSDGDDGIIIFIPKTVRDDELLAMCGQYTSA